jgi:L-alanine-DL-glutamate epimerase-like enolase superfamily enzyme
MALVEACRQAVGDEMEIMVDANQAGKDPDHPERNAGVTWDYARAVETAYRMEELGCYYLEEPLSYRLPGRGSRLRETSPIPIAGGEGKVGVPAFAGLIDRAIYDIIQPDPIVSGTGTDLLKIAALCEGHDLPVIYHHGKSGVGFMMGLHLSCGVGDSPWLEYMDDGKWWQPRGFQVGFSEVVPIDDEGYVHVPDRPGLGVDWDREWLRSIGLGDE